MTEPLAAPLLAAPPLVDNPTLIKVMVVKEKHVDQMPKLENIPEGFEVVGATRAFVVGRHGNQLIRIHKSDYSQRLMDRAQGQGRDYEAVRAAVAANVNNLPQLFEG
jgi:hypothetical protein